MFFLDQANGRCESDIAGDKDRLAISDPKGFASREPIGESLREVTKQHFSVALQGWSEKGLRQSG